MGPHFEQIARSWTRPHSGDRWVGERLGEVGPSVTTREHNKLKPTQAQTVIAAAILRHLHAVVTTGRAWDPTIAIHGIRTKTTAELAA